MARCCPSLRHAAALLLLASDHQQQAAALYTSGMRNGSYSLGPAGSVSLHHGRAVHGSDLNRSPNPRRLVVIECIAADAWPLVDAPADLSVFENQAMFGEPISMVPRMEVAPVRLPFPRRPTGSIYEAQLDIKNKAFARSKDEPAPRL